ncbi:hypothetical protein Q6A51_01515 [Pseudomonas sp. KFB-139]|uniref:Uncharacterized protein n=1 Tax=Pseudomonas serbiensis TaxID=3064350 RepID=A0ABT9CIX4_9PSED|nr:hypothetical protein [Pseudomonas sp. KFB-138]MDO7925437.1 hypothetical protein [Pseudomonas sp. KFB-138]
MIKKIIQDEKKHLRVINFTESGETSFNIDTEILPPNIALLPDGDHKAYYLSWRPNSGLYMDIPSTPNSVEPHIFLTANLSGCCVGVQNCGTKIRLRHYNLDDTDNIIFSQNDLSRYGDNIFWLMPNDKYKKTGIKNAKFYTHPSNGADAIFWGEYTSKKWNFYYQNGNYDTKIISFNY